MAEVVVKGEAIESDEEEIVPNFNRKSQTRVNSNFCNSPMK